MADIADDPVRADIGAVFPLAAGLAPRAAVGANASLPCFGVPADCSGLVHAEMVASMDGRFTAAGVRPEGVENTGGSKLVGLSGQRGDGDLRCNRLPGD